MTARPTSGRLLRIGTIAAAALAVLAPGANAHVQVSPTIAAPDDPIKVTLLVPNEREQSTRMVTLKVPPGVIPFSFGDTPGWERRNVLAPNGSIDQIVWTGRLARDGFVQLEFLASTPSTPGTIAWKSLQEYSDGYVARWIGTPDMDNPAPTTVISKDAPRQNAGGESDGGAPAAKAAAKTTVVQQDAKTDQVTRGLAIAALMLGAIALVRTFRRRAR